MLQNTKKKKIIFLHKNLSNKDLSKQSELKSNFKATIHQNNLKFSVRFNL